ncbi:MAG: alpha/beta fold hydrolase [Pseudohongiellaceae bacterium]
MTKRNQTLLIAITTVGIAALLTFWLLTPPPARFQPSPYAAVPPDPDDNFDDYVAENRARIRNALRVYYFAQDPEPFHGDYSLDEVTNMRAPFELTPASNCADETQTERLGILMAHGLTDSPYLLRPLANRLKFRYPCALIRGLLTPGHGTVPGDLLAADLDDWRATFEFGVKSFETSVDRLVVIGYSNGGALSLDHLNRFPRQDSVERMVLISPGLQSTSEQDWLAPWIWPIWPWINELPDADAAKYESFPTAAGAEFYRLTQRLRSTANQPADIPTLTLVSAEDTTVRSETTLRYYCQRLSNADSRMLWFGPLPESVVASACRGLEVVPVATDHRFRGYSHVAFTIPPSDPHYGVDGNYPVCLAYLGDADRFPRCRSDRSNTVYGELSLAGEDGMLDGRLLRRSTFNPAFDDMLEEIACFIAGSCD